MSTILTNFSMIENLQNEKFMETMIGINIGLQFSGLNFYGIVVGLMIFYREKYYKKHFFFKAAVQLAISDSFGIISLIFVSFGVTKMNIFAYFFTLTSMFMQLLVAFNRVCAVVIFNHYNSIFNRPLANYYCKLGIWEHMNLK